ncbi:uncharacterized protein A1O5_08101 [Cladophialophora psammophila CBS 110553]|uniref:Uncharacterized protein n=1 Tax=Cladophialophora psammophila CBS 110553 TaxID=1182543 RepID=W9WWY0_9EURO|nr:uncharacterized protein A1O5_08101 [Cladophialophora psammophila CBS 110553]EXJ69166.1 hypothetical protein A1O5_08101 [Cladophialophora psammophila CBS 110553]
MALVYFWLVMALLVGLAIFFGAKLLRVGMREKDLPPGKPIVELYKRVAVTRQACLTFDGNRTSDGANSGKPASDDSKPVSHVREMGKAM